MGARRAESPLQSAQGGVREEERLPLFIRRYSSTVEAKDEDERELISLTAKVPFDDRLHPTAKLTDLSVPLMRDFLKQFKSQLAAQASSTGLEALGRQMGVIEGPTEAPRPKNVGLLFSTKSRTVSFRPRRSMWSGFPKVLVETVLRRRFSKAPWAALRKTP